MKKLLPYLLCAAMLLILTACGGETPQSSAAPSGTAADTAAETAEAVKTSAARAETAAPTEAPATVPAETEAPETEAPQTETPETVPASSESETQVPSDSRIAALEKSYGGLTEDELKWDYNSATNTLTISGEGPMRDYSQASPDWDDYYDAVERIIIGDRVTSVSSCAFWEYEKLSEVKLGASVEYIGEYAFFGAWELRTVNFPDSLKYIGKYAFDNALLHSDHGFTLPEGLLYVGDNAFFSAFKESFLSLPASLTEIGDLAFANCFLEEFRIEEDNPAFAAEDGILYTKDMSTLINYPARKADTLYEIPETVTRICEMAIQVTDKLEKIVIPAAVSDIAEGAIYWNYGLSFIDVDESSSSYKSVDGVLYTRDGKLLLCYPTASARKEYRAEEGTERIAAHAFGLVSALEKLHVPEGVRSIGDSAFFGCEGLAEVGLPKSLEMLEDSAFNGCCGLMQVNYGGSGDDWKSVRIAENNDVLTSGDVKIYCAE